jgi:hypothetical protein
MIQIVYRNGYEFQIDLERPFIRFKGKSSKMPPVQATAPQPVAASDIVAEAAIAKARRRSGYEKTIITGELDTKNTGKLTKLG